MESNQQNRPQQNQPQQQGKPDQSAEIARLKAEIESLKASQATVTAGSPTQAGQSARPKWRFEVGCQHVELAGIGKRTFTADDESDAIRQYVALPEFAALRVGAGNPKAPAMACDYTFNVKSLDEVARRQHGLAERHKRLVATYRLPADAPLSAAAMPAHAIYSNQQPQFAKTA